MEPIPLTTASPSPNGATTTPKPSNSMFSNPMFGSILAIVPNLVRNSPNQAPKSAPNHFQKSFAQRKELQNAGVNKSNGVTSDPFWPSNFCVKNAVLRAQGDPGDKGPGDKGPGDKGPGPKSIFLGSPKKVPNTLKMFVIGHARDHKTCAWTIVCAAFTCAVA